MSLDLERLTGGSEAAISDSNGPWTWDGLKADTAAYLVVTQAGAQSTVFIKPFIAQRGSALFKVGLLFQRASWCDTRQQWDKPDSAAAFPFPSNDASGWGPAASLASFCKHHEGEGKLLTVTADSWQNPVWCGSLEIYHWAHQLLCALWTQLHPGECGRNGLGPHNVSQQAQFAWANLHKTAS